jgi:tetratricopeptide (TPR) repeat protein
MFFKSICLPLCLLFLLLTAGCGKQARLDRHIKKGDAYFAAKDYTQARLEYLNAIRLDPQNVHVLSQLAESLLSEGDLKGAGQLYSRVCQLQPTNSAALIKLGAIYLSAGDFKDANEYALKSLRVLPHNSEALVLLANSAIDTNQIKEAQSRIEVEQKASSSTNAALYFASGVLAQKSGESDKAAGFFAKATALNPTQSKYHLASAIVAWTQGLTNNANKAFQNAVRLAPDKSVERLRYAEFLFKTGQTEAGRKLLLEAIAKAPDFFPALNMLAEISIAANNLDDAGKYSDQVLAGDPKNHDALLARARIKTARRDYLGAMADLEGIIKLYPKDPALYFQSAIIELSTGDNTKALASLERALTLNPDYIDARLLKSEIQVSKGEANSAISDLAAVIKKHPRVPKAYYLLASAYRMRGSFGDAIATYSKLAALLPNDPQPVQLMGLAYRQENKINEARSSFEAALKIAPDQFSAVEGLIGLDLQAKQPAAALSRAEYYIKKYPTKPLPYILKAKVLAYETNYDAAIGLLQECIKLDPDFYITHRLLADLYVTAGKKDEAIAKLTALTAKNQKDTGSMLELAMLLEAKRDYANARSYYEKILAINPSSVPSLNNLAYLLSEHFQSPAEGFTYAQKARELAPYDPFSADTFAWITWEKGDYSHALNVLQQAAEKLPDQPEVVYHLGMAFYMNGFESQAGINLQNALNLKTNFTGAAQARLALSVLAMRPSDRNQQTLEQLSAILQKNPKDLFALIRSAEISEADKDYSKAASFYETALKINPRSATILARLAELNAFDLKDLKTALQLAKQAWSYSQDSSIAGPLGRVGFAAGDYKWAFARLADARQASPDNASISYYLAWTSYALGKASEAVDALQAALDAKSLPDALREHARAGLVLLKFQLGATAPTDVVPVVDRSLKENPNFVPALISSGLLAERNQDYIGARAQYETVLKSCPEHIAAQRQLAALLVEQFPSEAKGEQLLESLRLELQDDPLLRKANGIVAYRKGDYRQARTLLEIASSKLPRDPGVLFYLGMTQFQLKDKQAKISLTRALALDGSAPFSSEAKKVLSQIN